MDISSQFEEIQQEENLENDEKPPDSGGILFNQIDDLKSALGAGGQLFSAVFVFVIISIHIGFQAEKRFVFCY